MPRQSKQAVVGYLNFEGRSKIFRVHFSSDRSRPGIFVQAFKQVRPGWYLLAVRIRNQRQPWFAMLRLLRLNAPVEEVPLATPSINWWSNTKVEIAYLPDSAHRAELQVYGVLNPRDGVEVLLQPIPSMVAVAGVVIQSPVAFLRRLRAARGTWKDCLQTALVESSANSRTVPANYAQWLLMFDTWPERRLAPIIASLASSKSVHAIVFSSKAHSAALDATVASLTAQGSCISNIDVVRPRDAVPRSAAPFTAVLQAGETLSPHAVPLLLQAMGTRGQTDGVFADEDCLDADGTRCSPSFKPQPGLMMMCSGLLSRGIWLFRSALLPQGQMFDWAECLRLQIWFSRHETAPGCHIHRVPLVLTHRRLDAEAAPPEALAAVVNVALKRGGVRATALPVFPLRLNWSIDTQSTIDVIVPSRLRGAVQLSCMLDVLTRTTHPNFTMLIVVTQDMPLDAAQMMAAQQLEASGRARVLLLQRSKFNYSAANNYAARQARGELICLLNDDVSLLDGEWLGQMAARFSDPKTGIVGVKLYYPDGQTQHGGVILGLGGLAEHAHKFRPRGEAGYMSRAVLDQEMSAVTGACLMVRRALFEQVGGLDEELPTAFNDVDFCLRIRQIGHSVIMAASVELVHHETISFGHHYGHDAAAELADAQIMHRRWSGVIAADPYHNPNLSLRFPAEWDLATRPRQGLDYGADGAGAALAPTAACSLLDQAAHHGQGRPE
jgi:hypothetical protein